MILIEKNRHTNGGIIVKEHHVCPWWLAYTFDNPLRRFLHRPQVIFKDLVRPGMTVMDIGCGMGYFSLALAEFVGAQGCVIAVDLQPEMLKIFGKRARKAGVGDRIRTQLCEPASLNVFTKVDFVLAFWMAHETPDPEVLFRQIAAVLKPGGRLLLAEPRFHVSAALFQKIMTAAGKAGLKLESTPRIAWSRAAIFSGVFSG